MDSHREATIQDSTSPRPQTEAPRLPELLSPAGDWDCAKAAVENGADAIYFGLDKFNARMRANNFTEADLPRLMEFLHRRGVKGYLTFNTLVFQNEVAEAEQYLKSVIAAGVDATIVQDVGICRLIRQLSPDFPIHVSTQMTITSEAGVEFARELGCNLVVLARECSLKEIARITSANREIALPIEVFVHGALCVAYSGQCLTSESLGGRSANRGECAQACRMPYELVSDGNLVPLGDRKYLLSPQDLAGLEILPELTRIGVASLKIEGRLKAPEYVANITRIYRQALDRLAPSSHTSHETPASRSAELHSGLRSRQPQSHERDAQYDMEMAFSRGLYTGWFGGINNQRLVHARFGKKRGVYLGEVLEVRRDSVLIDLEGPLKPGDGVVFDAGHPEEQEQGGRVYEIRSTKFQAPRSKETSNIKYQTSDGSGHAMELKFGREDIDFGRVHRGDKLWKTSDPELERRLRQTFEGETPKFQRPLTLEVHGLEGKPLSVLGRDELGNVARVDSTQPLVKAEKQPLTTERLCEQLGRLGGTVFRLGELKNQVEGEVMLPLSELNRLRRELVAELEVLRAKPPRWTLLSQPVSGASGLISPNGGELFSGGRPSRSQQRPISKRIQVETPGLSGCDVERTAHEGSLNIAATETVALRATELIVMVRSFAQLDAALASGVQTIYCEFEDPKKYREAVTKVRAFSSHPEIWVAPPRIFKMGEDWTLKQVRSCDADGYLIRNYDHLKFFANERRRGDYSLNVANRLTAEYFRERFGLERVTASYDLNFEQLEALLRAAPPEWFEITIHQHMPMFHMEHCVFCAFLSSGTDYTNCGRPCDRHELKMRDRVGAEHPVKADAGCRNTVFNALAQTGADYVPNMLALGVQHFRLEFLNESSEQVERAISKYRKLLCGEITGAEVWRELKLFNQLGVTRGQIGRK